MNRQRERRRWKGMLDRCGNPDGPAWKNYGGRGIVVCERWHDFENYYADIMRLIGPCPGRKSIDRIDNDGNYEPGNVRWASPWQQVANSRNYARARSAQLPEPKFGPQWRTLVPDGPVPVYEQIASFIRTDIEAGLHAPGSAIPGVARITQETGCTHVTVRKGIKLLADEGLVVIVPGKGTFVARRENGR